MAGTKLRITRGDTKAWGITVTRNGVAVDITDWTIFFTVKETRDDDATDAAALIAKTVTKHSDPTHGISEIEIEPADTEDLAPGEYVYDFQFVTDTGKAYSPDELSGDFVIQADVTRRTA